MVPSVAFIQSLLKKGNGGRRIVHWKNALVQTRSGQAFRPDNATRGPFEVRLLDQSVEQQNGDVIDQCRRQARPGARDQREAVGLEIADRVHWVPQVAIGPRGARPFPVVRNEEVAPVVRAAAHSLMTVPTITSSAPTARTGTRGSPSPRVPPLARHNTTKLVASLYIRIAAIRRNRRNAPSGPCRSARYPVRSSRRSASPM